jgi:hypothetical protein
VCQVCDFGKKGGTAPRDCEPWFADARGDSQARRHPQYPGLRQPQGKATSRAPEKGNQGRCPDQTYGSSSLRAYRVSQEDNVAFHKRIEIRVNNVDRPFARSLYTTENFLWFFTEPGKRLQNFLLRRLLHPLVSVWRVE